MKRIFIGIPLSEELQSEAVNLSKRRAPLNSLRWVKPEFLHITLIQPWQSKAIEDVVGKLKQIQARAFPIFFNAINYGPNQREPRLLWATGKTPEEIINLSQNIKTSLKGLVDIPFGRTGYQPREFLLHATLARVRGGQEKKLPDMAMPIAWRMQAREFVLYESVLKPEGAHYTPLASFALT